MKPKFCIPAFSLALALLAATLSEGTAQTRRDWTGAGDAVSWNDPLNWQSENVPVNPTYFAQFTAGTTASINVPDGSTTARMTLDGNTDINLALASSMGNTLATFGLLRVGHTAAGNASLTFSGSGRFEGLSFQIGSTTNSNGNTMTFGGNTSVHFTSANSISNVGRFGSNNALVINNGNTNSIAVLYVGSTEGTTGNRTSVSGVGTKLEVGSTGTNRGLRIGHANGADYATGLSNNRLEVLNGGTALVTTSFGGTTSNYLYLGTGTYAHNNSILVDGVGSRLELGKGVATSGNGTDVSIGDAGATNSGGNYIEVRNGGSIASVTGHTGNITIHGYNSSADNDGRNYFSVGDGGSVDIGGSFIVNSRGDLRLAASGSLSANAITVNEGGRFEAAGSGLATTGSTIINAGGFLAIGEADATTASQLTLSSSVSLASGAELQLTLYSAASSDQIQFANGGLLSITDGASLRLALENYTPIFGDSWVLFTGQTSGISGNFAFDLPTLSGGLAWNTNSFNQAGGWELSVIPEPATTAFLAVGGLLLAVCRLRKIRRC